MRILHMSENKNGGRTGERAVIIVSKSKLRFLYAVTVSTESVEKHNNGGFLCTAIVP